MITVEKLIKELQTLDPKARVLVSSDEEWNTLFEGVEIQIDEETDDVVIFGCSGTEVEE